MYIVNIDLLFDLGEFFLVESVSQFLNIRLKTSVTIDAVDDAMFFDELSTYREYFGHVLLSIAQMLA